MEQHPVPQNIASFEFKLIGDITLKQFAFVGVGLFLGYLATRFTLLPAILRWPIAGSVAFLGVGLAFFPVNGQPLDRWLGAFFKSIYAPTQFVWQKDNQPPEYIVGEAAAKQITPPAVVKFKNPPPSVVAAQNPQTVTVVAQKPLPTPVAPIKSTAPPAPPMPMSVPIKPTPPPVSQTPIMKSTPIKFTPVPQAPPVAQGWTIAQKTTTPVNQKQPTPPAKRVVFDQKLNPPKPVPVTMPKQPQKPSDSQIAELQKELQSGHVAKERLLEMQQMLASLINEKDQMSKELIKLKQQSVTPQQPAVKPVAYSMPQNDTKTTVKIVSPQSSVKSGIPRLTTVPNVITGIIKDSQGILLPNMIVTVKDHEHMPVRALKSNKLGQFAASTSLSNGTYILEVEDPSKRFGFAPIEISLTGQVLEPIEISATNQRDLMRQKLTQEIFGKNTL